MMERRLAPASSSSVHWEPEKDQVQGVNKLKTDDKSQLSVKEKEYFGFDRIWGRVSLPSLEHSAHLNWIDAFLK